MRKHAVVYPPVDSEPLSHPDIDSPDRSTAAARAVSALGDAELTSAMGRSDRLAFAEVYRRHAGHVRAMAARLCGSNAEDVVQEVFLGLWERPERFDPRRGSLTSFLLTMAHNRAVDAIRAEDRRRAREVRGESPRTMTDDGAEEPALSRLESVAISEFLHRLPDPEREAIALAYLGGHTYRRVAALLQQPEGTIKTRVRTGLARLAGLIEEPGQPGATRGVMSGSQRP